MDDRERRIREHAHRLWLEEGCPDGRAEAHWDMASELVAIEDNQKLATEANPARHGKEVAERDEPVEPAEAVENQGETPVLADQGEKQTTPPRRGRQRTRRSNAS